MSTVGAIRGAHGRSHFDIVHGLWADTSGFAALVAGRLLRVPSVVTVAGGEMVSLPDIEYGGSRTRKGRMLVAATLRLATAVTSAAEFTLGRLRARRPDARLIILGADTGRFAPPTPSQLSTFNFQLPLNSRLPARRGGSSMSRV
jgi:hypothetical protein